jgi:prepilin-type processing-associated H-X9-DG protein
LTATTITATSDVSLDGGSFVFNESSADKDFRIESNGNANMLFVDGGNDVIGIKTATPTNYYADDLVVTVPDEGGITIVGGTTERNYLAFADGTSGNARYRGLISYDHNTDLLTLGAGGGGSVVLDGDGVVSNSTQPSIAMDATSSGAISFSGSDKLITEWTSFHTVGITYSSSNGRFTVPTAGKYLITVHIYLYQNDAFQRLQVLDNDSIFVHSSADFNSGDGDMGQDNTLSCTIIRDLSANDYITFTMLDGGGRIMMQGAHSHCAIHKLS